MSVAFVTTRGAFVIDLFLKSAPMQGFNMLKLAKLGFYENTIFSEILSGFYIKLSNIQIPGGRTIYGLLTGKDDFYLKDEINTKLTHSKSAYISTFNKGKDMNTSEFFITLGRDLSHFDKIRTIFGQISEGFEIIEQISKEFVDDKNRPYKNIRILFTRVLYDPFDDPPGFDALQKRFVKFPKVLETDRLEEDEVISDFDPIKEHERIENMKKKHNAEILELLGDIPDIDAQPPETTLFVCRLHPRTNSDGLKIVFSRFGKVVRVDLIKDKKTGESLRYAFVEFEKPSECENAFKKMQNAVIDNRRISVDFCQSLNGPSTKN